METNKKKFMPLILFFCGLHFGILQSALYFEVLVNVTATFMGYFLIIATWMLGVVYYLKFYKKKRFTIFLIISIVSYYTILILTNIINTSIYLFIPMLPFVFVSASVVGEFFKEFSHLVSGGSLLFHENNGFVFGIILSIVLFTVFGTNFLLVAPIVSCLIVYFSYNNKHVASFGLIVLAILHSLFFQYWLSAALLGILFFSCSVYLLVKAEPIEKSKVEKLFEVKNYQKKTILFIAGLNIILLQYFIVREFSSILSANELSIMLVSAVYFVGFSIGYYVSKKISFTYLKIISSVMLFLHVFIFVFIKYFASQMISAGYGFEALILLFIIAAFVTSGFYSIFLPKFIEYSGAEYLKNAYSWEIFGAIIGTSLVYLMILFSVSFLWSIYFLLFLVLVIILIKESRWTYSYLLVGFFVIGLFSVYQKKIFKYSTEDYYKSRNYKNSEVLFSKNSFYHTVDVIDTYYDKSKRVPNERTSFINGIRYFQYKYDLFDGFYKPTSLSEFTYYLAELPAKYLSKKLNRKLRILILGGGSLYSINRVAAYSKKTTLVEIDPVVVEAAKEYWPKFNKFDKIDNYEIIIDDAKHYIKATDEKFDLIIMDISAPYYLGTALLHNEDFFSLVKKKLKFNGIFSESTQNRPNPNYPNSIAMKILKSVRNVFSKYSLIDCKDKNIGKHGFVFATTNLILSTSEITAVMKNDKRYFGTTIYQNDSPHFKFDKTIPISLTNMSSLFSSNKNRIMNRLKLKSQSSKLNVSDFIKIKNNSKLINAIEKKFINPVFRLIILILIIIAFSLRYSTMIRRILKLK